MSVPRLITALAFALAFAAGLHAQTPYPSPSPTDATAPGKSPRDRVGFVRVWYFGTPKSPLVTVAGTAPTGAPITLGSGMRPGIMGNYRMMKAGSYSLNIIDGSIIPDENGHLSITRPLAPPIKVDIRGNSFVTLVVQDKEGSFSVDSYPDQPATPETGSVMRTFNFTDQPDLAITYSHGKKDHPLWDTKSQNPEILRGVVAAGPCHFELVREATGNQKVLAAFEAPVTTTTACTIVAYPDRYGDPALIVVDDAKSPFGEEAIKAVAGP